MRSRTALVIVFVATLCTSIVYGDGKMFWKDVIPPSIPYQRAIVLFDDSTETLIVQSKYEIEGSKYDGLGWVIPIPSVPEVAGLSEDSGFMAFHALGMISRPKVTNPYDIIFSLVAILLIVAFAYSLLNLKKKPKGERRKHLAHWGLLIFLLLLSAMMIPAFNKVRSISGVDIIDATSVGIYDIQVIRSNRSDLLISWLNNNGFKYSSDDRIAFEHHIKNNWCFVVAKVNQSAMDESDYTRYDSLVPPLALRFESSTPIYPLALTATGGHETEILIYVLSDKKMLCDGRLPLRYSSKINMPDKFKDSLSYDIEPPDFFDGHRLNYSYLTKFKGLLTPEQMKKDLVFTPSVDQTPFREHIVKW